MPKLLKPGVPDRGLYQRGKTWWLYYSVKGEPVRVSLKTRNKTEAIRKAGSLRGRPRWAFAESEVAELLKRYIAAEQEEGNFTPSTARSTHYACTRSLELLAVEQASLFREISCQDFYDSLNEKSEATARTYSMRLHAFMQWLFAEELIPHEPDKIEFSKHRKVARRTSYVTWETARRIIATTRRFDLKFVLYCGFFCGMRKNEFIMARPQWFNLSTRKITIPEEERTTLPDGRVLVWKTKSKLARSIPIHAEFAAWLGAHREFKRDALFVLHPTRASSIYRWDPKRPFDEIIAAFRKQTAGEYGEAIEKAGAAKQPTALIHDPMEGMTVSMHTMRHSFITALANSGKYSATQISMWSGDQVRTIESNYMHPSVRGDELDDL